LTQTKAHAVIVVEKVGYTINTARFPQPDFHGVFGGQVSSNIEHNLQ